MPVAEPAPARAVLAAVAVTTAGVLPVFLAGALAVQLERDIGLTGTGLGLAVAAFFGTGALTSTQLGRLGERWSSRVSLRVAALFSCALLLTVAAVVRTWQGLVLALAVAGLGNALAQPAANLLVSRSVPLERQGWALAVKQSAIPTATLLGGLAVPALAVTVGWRWAYVGAAIVALAAAASPPAMASLAASKSPSHSATDPLTPLVLLAVALGLGAAGANCLGSFLVSTAVRSGLTPAQAGWTLSLGSVASIVGRLLAGRLADRRGRRHLIAVALMLACGAIGELCMASGAGWLVVVATPVAFGLGWAWPGVSNLAVVKNYAKAPASATGVSQTGVYLGAVLGPLGFGVVAERSYALAWILTAGSSMISAVLVVLARRQMVAALGARTLDGS